MRSKDTKNLQPETDFLDKTIEVWQPIIGRELTKEDARQIKENVTGFIKTLLRWDAIEKDSNTAKADLD